MAALTSRPTIERTAALIREWVSAADCAADPKPMALPFLAEGDPVALAGITLRTIREGILTGDMGLARLALIVGATAEREAAGGKPKAGWGTEAQVRVGLALIDCAMRATAGLTLAAGPSGRPTVSSAEAAGRRTVRSLVAGRCVTVAVPAEDAADLPGDGIELRRAVPMGRA